MTDTYTQLVNNPVGGFVAKNLGLPQPVELDRYERGRAADRRPRPARLGARRPARRSRSPTSSPAHDVDVDSPARRRGPRGARRRPASTPASGTPTRPADQRWKALVFDATGIASSEQLRELWAFFHPTIRRLEPVRPPDRARHAARGLRRAARGDRAARARGLRPRRRQGGPLRRDRPAALRRRRAPRTGSARRCASSSRPRSAYVSGQLAADRRRAATSPEHRLASGRCTARSRSSPAPRAASARRSPGRSRATAPTSSASTSRRSPRTSSAVVGSIGGSAIVADITDPEAPATICDALAGAPRRRRRRRPQRRRHPRQDARRHGRGALGPADGHQPDQRGADQRRAARARPAATRTAGSSASPR